MDFGLQIKHKILKFYLLNSFSLVCEIPYCKGGEEVKIESKNFMSIAPIDVIEVHGYFFVLFHRDHSDISVIN